MFFLLGFCCPFFVLNSSLFCAQVTSSYKSLWNVCSVDKKKCVRNKSRKNKDTMYIVCRIFCEFSFDVLLLTDTLFYVLYLGFKYYIHTSITRKILKGNKLRKANHVIVEHMTIYLSVTSQNILKNVIYFANLYAPYILWFQHTH